MAGIYRLIKDKLGKRNYFLLAGVNVGFNQNLTGRENIHLYGSTLAIVKKSLKK